MDNDLENLIQSEILNGKVPSIVFRRILEENHAVDKYEVGTLFQQAFPNVDGVVWNVVAHWQNSEPSPTFDIWMDIQLIKALLDAEYDLAWNRNWISDRWTEIKNDWTKS